MSDAPRYSTLRDYLQVMRAQRWVIIIVTLTVVAIAFGYSSQQTTIYKATARLQVNDSAQDAATLQAFVAPTTPEQEAAQAASLVTRPEVAAVVKRRLALTLSISDLQSRVSGQAETRTNFVDVSSEDHNPQVALLLANQFAKAARDLETKETRQRYSDAATIARKSLVKVKPKGDSAADKLNRLTINQAIIGQVSRLNTLAQFVTPVAIAVPATLPTKPVSPKPVRDSLIGLIIGLTLALLAAFMRDALDRRLKKSSEIRAELDLPLIGHVRQEVMGRTVIAAGKLPALSEIDLEAFRIIKTNVEYLNVDAPPKTLLVTSALPEEGKSTVSAGLAFANVAAGRRVLLVETDLRRPVLAPRLGLQPGPGLSDYLAGRAEPGDILQTVAIPGPTAVNGNGPEPETTAGLVVIVAGTPTSRPAEILSSERFRTFLATVRDAYDVVILDSTPLLSVVDALELLPHVDGVVLCARSVQTTRDQLRAARQALERAPDRPTGVVVTGLSARDEAEYGYYSYAYAYTSTS